MGLPTTTPVKTLYEEQLDPCAPSAMWVTMHKQLQLSNYEASLHPKSRAMVAA